MDIFRRPLFCPPCLRNRGLVGHLNPQVIFLSLTSAVYISMAKARRSLEVRESTQLCPTQGLWFYSHVSGSQTREIWRNTGKIKKPVSALKELRKAFYFLIIYCKLMLNSLVLRECRAGEWARTSVDTRSPNYQAPIPLGGHCRVSQWLWEATPVSTFTNDILWHYE